MYMEVLVHRTYREVDIVYWVKEKHTQIIVSTRDKTCQSLFDFSFCWVFYLYGIKKKWARALIKFAKIDVQEIYSSCLKQFL